MNTLWTIYHLPRTPRGRALLAETGIILALAGIGLFSAAALLGAVL